MSEIVIKSSLINDPEFKWVKESLIAASEKDGKDKFRVKCLEYINDSSSEEDDIYFYDMLEFVRFLDPSDDSTAYTTPDKLIYLNCPSGGGNPIGENLKQWDFTYDHECMHQVWDTFGVADKIKENKIEYNHYILNIASDCVINDYLVFYRKKSIPNNLITPQYLKEKYGVEYDRKTDTQYTLYLKLLAIKQKLEKDQNLQKQAGDQQQGGDSQQGGGSQSGSGGSGQSGDGNGNGNSSSGGSDNNGNPQQGEGGSGSSDADIDKMSGDEAAKDAQKSADKAKEAADKAKKAADAAKEKADKSGDAKDKEAADKAKEVADKAKEAADKSQKAADEAKDAADKGDEKEAREKAKEARDAAKEAEDASDKAEGKDGKDGDKEGKEGKGGGKSAGKGHIEGKETPEDLEKIKKKAEAIIEKYKNKISGDFGKFIKQCKSSVECRKSGLMTYTEHGNPSWNQEMNSYIKAYVKKKVFLKKREFESTYRRIKRGKVVKPGEVIEPGKRVKKKGMTINGAFYLDRSGSMGNSLKECFKASYIIAEALKKQYKKEKVVDEITFKMFAFDDYIEPVKWGNTMGLGGGTMAFQRLLKEIKERTNDHLINVIITDAAFPSIDEREVEKFVKEINGMVLFVTNNDNVTIKNLAKKLDTKLFYVLADSNFTIKL